jgi:hypothetical protein
MDSGAALLRSPAVVLLAFLAGLALVVAATVFSTVRALRFWRQAKHTGAALAGEVALFEERSARTEKLLAEADRAGGDLQLALERLRVSRARLQVLTGELGRAQKRVGWLRAFLPVR